VVCHQDVPAVHSSGAAAPVPGTVFAGHLVEAVVGRGGMGVVHRARHCGLARVVALKTIRPELLDDASTRRRFMEEAIAAASIEHPNVVPVHDAGEADGVAYIVMRYVDGMDLRELVRYAGPLDAMRAADIVVTLAEALHALHETGYVHRDVKPRNVLIANCGHVYLSDFGLARQVAGERTGETRRGHWVGTVDFAAPEQICGGRTDARTDVYALGCLLYFALTGKAPYAREDDEATLWAHLYEAPPSPRRVRPDVPAGMDDLIARALAKEPGERFQTARDFARAARRVASGSTPFRSRRTPPARRAALAEAPTVPRVSL
jgi:serine/threonine protein kinase